MRRETLNNEATDSSVMTRRRPDGTFGARNAAHRGRGGELREWRAAFRERFDGERLGRVVDAMFKAALNGNVHAARLLFDHALGRPRERIDLTMEGSVAIEPMDPSDPDYHLFD
jgi:hypothetical protein